MAWPVYVPPSAPPAPPPVPYDLDLSSHEARAAVVARLRARFPGVTVWYGETTRRWWAMLPQPGRRGRLMEAATPGELVKMITSDGRPVPS